MSAEFTTSGKEAAALAEKALAAGEPFHTYIIDWQMPEMSGIETAQKLRKLTGGGDASIIVIAAYDLPDVA